MRYFNKRILFNRLSPIIFTAIFFLSCGKDSGMDSKVTDVNIPDANLRAIIADSLGKASGEAITSAEMATLTRLDAQNKSISDLTGLEHATNLTRLTLDAVSGERVNSNAISDISPLSGLTSLQVLLLGENRISEVSALSGLTSLQYLALEANSISDISPLSGLTNLTLLYINSTSISDISPLSGLTNLTQLYLRNTSISDISPLSGLTSLQVLLLDRTSISDISPLSGLTRLISLDIGGTSISDISPLSGLTSLEQLGLDSNQHLGHFAVVWSDQSDQSVCLANNRISESRPSGGKHGIGQWRLSLM